MSVDVTVEVEIDRPREIVAAYASNPDNIRNWYANIDAVSWLTDPPLQIGSRVSFAARFLGRKLEYTYEIVELVPAERLVMRTAEGPFPMQTCYTWTSTPQGTTRMSLRNSGKLNGFSLWLAPFMRIAIRRATHKDLQLLKRILEDSAQRAD